jgi:single-strand DNA-binding protein
MANLNKVMLIGNLTRDPELRYTPKGTPVTDIGLAINRVWTNEQGNRQEETVFVDVTLWGRQAELANQYLSKGRCAYIEGRLQMDTWDDKDTGKKRSKLKVVAEAIQFMPDGKGQVGGQPQAAPSGTRPAPARHSEPDIPQGGSAAPAGDYADQEDDIPF